MQHFELMLFLSVISFTFEIAYKKGYNKSYKAYSKYHSFVFCVPMLGTVPEQEQAAGIVPVPLLFQRCSNIVPSVTPGSNAWQMCESLPK